MVKVIMGLKGSGKTKKLVELVQQAAENEKGAVVCIEKKKNLSTEIPHSVRLIRAQEYGIFGIDMFKGYIAGLYSGNYDITQIFVDNFYKIIDTNEEAQVAEVLGWLEAFSNANGVTVTLSLSGDADKASDALKKYFI